MNDKLDKAFAISKKEWDTLKQASPPEISSKLLYIEKLMQKSPADADKEWGKLLLSFPEFVSATRQRTYEGYRNTIIELQGPAAKPVDDTKIETNSKSRSSAGGPGIRLSDEDLFNISVHKMETELVRYVKEGKDIPPDLFSQCVQATVIEHFVNPNDKRYKSAQDEALGKWSQGKTPEQIKKLGDEYKKSHDFITATNKLYLAQNPKSAKAIASMVDRINAKKESLARDYKKDYLFNRILVPLASGYLQDNIEVRDPKNKKPPNIVESKLYLDDKSQKRTAEFLQATFRTKFSNIASQDALLKTLLDKYGVSLPVLPSAWTERKLSFAWPRQKEEIREAPSLQERQPSRKSAFAKPLFSVKEPVPSAFLRRPNLLSIISSPAKISTVVIIIVLMAVFSFLIPGGTNVSLESDQAGKTGMVQIFKTANKDSIAMNEQVIFTINTNYTNISSSLILNDPIPSNATFVSCDGDCSVSTDSNGQSVAQWTINTGSSSNQDSSPVNNSVYFLGDSIGAMSQGQISSSLSTAGWKPIINALTSRKLVGLDRLGGTYQADADKNQISNVGTVIVELGTNDCLESSTTFKKNLNTLYSKLVSINPTAKYYWVDYAFKDGSLACKASDAPLKNQDLKDFIADGNKNITIIPWSSVGISFLDSSGVHPTASGKEELAKITLGTIGSYNSSSVATSATSDSTGLAGWLDKQLASTGLSGTGQAFVDYSAQYNVPIELAYAQFAFETALYSDSGRTVKQNSNNPGNITCPTGPPFKWGAIDNNVTLTVSSGYTYHYCVFSSLSDGIKAFFMLLDSDRYRSATDQFISTSDPTAILKIYYGEEEGFATTEQYINRVNNEVSKLRTAAAKDGITLSASSGNTSATSSVTGTARFTITLAAKQDNTYIVNQASTTNASSNCSVVKVGNPQGTPSLPASCSSEATSSQTGVVYPASLQENSSHPGYYYLPNSPDGSYVIGTCDGKRWGGKDSVAVITTVAARWRQKYPQGYIKIWDMVAGNHKSHQWGNKFDINASTNGQDCAANYTGRQNPEWWGVTGNPCSSVYNKEATIELGKMLINTGVVAQIIYADANVVSVLRSYVKEVSSNVTISYMSDHVSHFHVKVGPNLALWYANCQ